MLGSYKICNSVKQSGLPFYNQEVGSKKIGSNEEYYMASKT